MNILKKAINPRLYFSLLYLHGYWVSTSCLLVLEGFCTNGLIEFVKFHFVGEKILSLHYQNQEVLEESLDLKVQYSEMSKNLYADIEPYNTGFLKVSEIHTLYYEESGNPSGHVSYLYLCVRGHISSYFKLIQQWI